MPADPTPRPEDADREAAATWIAVHVAKHKGSMTRAYLAGDSPVQSLAEAIAAARAAGATAEREACLQIARRFDEASSCMSCTDTVKIAAAISARAIPLSPPAPPHAPAPEETVFSCPHCGSPSAHVMGRELDIHAGATYKCDLCHGKVIFEALTVEQYVAKVGVSLASSALRAAGTDGTLVRAATHLRLYADLFCKSNPARYEILITTDGVDVPLRESVTTVLAALAQAQADLADAKAVLLVVRQAAGLVENDDISLRTYVEEMRRKLVLVGHSHVPRLRAALEAAEQTFRTYAELHAKKGTPEGNTKALANQEQAERCRIALILSQLGQPDPGPVEVSIPLG